VGWNEHGWVPMRAGGCVAGPMLGANSAAKTAACGSLRIKGLIADLGVKLVSYRKFRASARSIA
jgi:hypothetical protein